MSIQRTDEFIQEFTAWAQSQPGVLAAALVGSRARGTAGPDSDVDLVLLCTRAADYLADLSWTLQFGEVREHRIEPYGRLTSVRTWYEDGLEIEYGITDEDWAASPLDEGTRQVISDGMVVLYEEDKLLSRHQPVKQAPRPFSRVP